MITIANPIIGDLEKAAVMDVLNSGNLAQGSKVREFEEAFAKYVNAEYAVAVSSGTAALHRALRAHGVGGGDSVVTTPFSFMSTANAIIHCNAYPVFGDISEESFNLTPESAEAAINPSTHAVMPVHLYGLSADIDGFEGLSARSGVPIIEDACQAHGATYKGQMIGSINTTCFSFYPSKNMTTGEGGMVTTNDPTIADKVRTLRSHGVVEDVIGFNYRMTDIQAAIGCVQLDSLDDWNAIRGQNARLLTHLLSDSVICPKDTEGHVYHQYTVRIKENRDEVLLKLNEAGIGARVYYDTPIHKMYPYSVAESTRPTAEMVAKQVLSLPVHPGVSAEDIERIAEVLKCALA